MYARSCLDCRRRGAGSGGACPRLCDACSVRSGGRPELTEALRGKAASCCCCCTAPGIRATNSLCRVPHWLPKLSVHLGLVPRYWHRYSPPWWATKEPMAELLSAGSVWFDLFSSAVHHRACVCVQPQLVSACAAATTRLACSSLKLHRAVTLDALLHS